ncbi:10673_t:CDS:2 [Dentiscutata erythropus]|uniref:10673_t:CDS:1 n=1 Tax=Dentiscutata erythropus TaxID=1348616 RepID=A0A9N9ISJ5_9GLOM|nr:10673_t:CDS:2 [Dentiscutata erythropus]
MRTYNAPKANEVAIIYNYESDEQKQNERNIIIKKNNNTLIRISELHGAYNPLQYLLLFIFEEYGWHKEEFLKIIEEEIVNQFEEDEKDQIANQVVTNIIKNFNLNLIADMTKEQLSEFW